MSEIYCFYAEKKARLLYPQCSARALVSAVLDSNSDEAWAEREKRPFHEPKIKFPFLFFKLLMALF